MNSTLKQKLKDELLGHSHSLATQLLQLRRQVLLRSVHL